MVFQRRGDISPRRYWYHVLAMRARYGIRSIFLATDDQAVVEEARREAAAADIPLFTTVAGPPAGVPLWDIVLSRGTIDAPATAASVVDDLILLARCDARACGVDVGM